mmetsp:Transcript_11701/g.29556  ORF Transcript_11701/g.29556 Transcript_11701/m.29556 type:complete len:256 (+) Transcript_11701:1784-2551(+)
MPTMLRRMCAICLSRRHCTACLKWPKIPPCPKTLNLNPKSLNLAWSCLAESLEQAPSFHADLDGTVRPGALVAHLHALYFAVQLVVLGLGVRLLRHGLLGELGFGAHLVVQLGGLRYARMPPPATLSRGRPLLLNRVAVLVQLLVHRSPGPGLHLRRRLPHPLLRGCVRMLALQQKDRAAPPLNELLGHAPVGCRLLRQPREEHDHAADAAALELLAPFVLLGVNRHLQQELQDGGADVDVGERHVRQRLQPAGE